MKVKEVPGILDFTSTDYSDMNNWNRFDYTNPERADTDVDVFYFYGTTMHESGQGNGVCLITDEMKASKKKSYDVGESVFDDGVRLYVPYYRQLSGKIENTVCEYNQICLDLIENTEVGTDICAALDYYFENCNEGRPFIIAGYSQGGAAVQVALDMYFGDPDHRTYLDNMVAAYSAGFGVDKIWLAERDYLKFAAGAYDTGVILSWNTEGPGDKGKNPMLSKNPEDTLVINPINWKTDDTYAGGEECLGSFVDGETITPGAYNLQYDPERGSLICDNNTDYAAEGRVWGGKSLHMYEYPAAYYSIRQNMHDRVDAFLKKKKLNLKTQK